MNRKDVFQKNTYHLTEGDMIIYMYEGEKLRGRVIKLHENNLEIEICIGNKKSENVYLDRFTVEYEDVLPLKVGLQD